MSDPRTNPYATPIPGSTDAEAAILPAQYRIPGVVVQSSEQAA